MQNVIFSHHVMATNNKVQELQNRLSKLLGAEAQLKAQRDFKPKDELKGDEWERLIVDTVEKFDVFVITTLNIGRATTKTANLMKIKGKKVLFFNGRELLPVRYIKTVNANDWRAGWMCIYGDRVPAQVG